MTRSPAPVPIARAQVALDPQWTIRPWPHPDPVQGDPVRHWRALLDAGLIPNRTPPSAPEVVAIRAANDALFRRIAADRRRLARDPRR